MTRRNNRGKTTRGRRFARRFRNFRNKITLGKANVNETGSNRPPVPAPEPTFLRPTAVALRPERGGARPSTIPRRLIRRNRGTSGVCHLCGKDVGHGHREIGSEYSPHDRLEIHMALSHGEFGNDGPAFSLERGGDFLRPELSISPAMPSAPLFGCSHIRGVFYDHVGERICKECGLVLSSPPLVAGRGWGKHSQETQRHLRRHRAPFFWRELEARELVRREITPFFWRELDRPACNKCGSARVRMEGRRFNRTEVTQRFRCLSCRHCFSEPNSPLMRLRTGRDRLLSRMLVLAEHAWSVPRITLYLDSEGLKVSRATVWRWLVESGVQLKSLSKAASMSRLRRARKSQKSAKQLRPKLMPWLLETRPIEARPPCDKCGSEKVNLLGKRYNKGGPSQRFLCLSCGRSFSDQTSPLNKLRHGREHFLTEMRAMVEQGQSTRQVTLFLHSRGLKLTNATVWRWLVESGVTMRPRAEAAAASHGRPESREKVRATIRRLWQEGAYRRDRRTRRESIRAEAGDTRRMGTACPIPVGTVFDHPAFTDHTIAEAPEPALPEIPIGQ